ADEATLALVRDELREQPADLFFFLPAEREAKTATQREIQNLEKMIGWSSNGKGPARVIELRPDGTEAPSLLEQARDAPATRAALLGFYSLGKAVHTSLASHLPNEARVELVRSSC